MNWAMLAAVGQLGAVCLGIPSIVYLAVQIRRQTKERKQAAVHALTEQWGDLTSSLHDSAELADLFLRGLRSFGDLTPTDKVRFSAFFNRVMNVFEGMYFSHREGILIDSSWRAVERMLEDFITNRGPQEWWVTRKRWHPAEFVQIVDDVVARADQSTAFAHYELDQSARASGKV